MTQQEIIEIATKVYGECDWHESALLHLEAFAKLVRNDYSNKHAQLWIKRIEDAVKAEREACAIMVDKYIKETESMEARGCLASVAYDIRARGQL